MALNIKLHGRSSELRQDLTIILNFMDHSHHSLASFLKIFRLVVWTGF